MQPDLKRMLTVLAGIGSIAMVAVLAVFLMLRGGPTQPVEPSQALSSAVATTENPTGGPMVSQDTADLREPAAPRHTRGKNRQLRSVVSENRSISLPLESAPADDSGVGTLPSSNATVEDVADSLAPRSDAGEPSDEQAVLATPPALNEGHLSAYVEKSQPAAPQERYQSTYLAGRASKLLTDIRTEGAGLRLNAETLGTFAWNPLLSWQSHAFYLDRVKSHINAVGKYLAEFEQIRHAVLPWQQQAVAEVTSHAAQVAASTQAAIIHLRENQDRLFVPEYRNHLKMIADHSGTMKQTVDKFLNYEKTRQEFWQLQRDLELSGD